MIPLPGSAPAHPSRGDGDAELDGADSAHLGVRFSSPRTGLTVLTVCGEVDTLTAPRLEVALDELLALAPDGEGRDLAVDLEGVTFLASSGLGVLIHTARRASRDDRRLYVVATNRAVLRPLEVTGSAQLFTVLADQDAIPGRDGVPGP
ncbi:STAS domain-containing protein [Pseudonocardia spirodelae]|uniref:Anti-sigma factor antagonist n=1 Tax=Pseudonocardia spirodelae TaxID=3133431 RepID=A0ABU8T3U1_9PSEU